MSKRTRIDITNGQLPTIICLAVAVLVGAATRVAGQTSAGGPDTSPALAADSQLPIPGLSNRSPIAADKRYRIQRGDSLELTFPLAPNFNQAMTVQPDGFITPRAIGDQRAEGLTVPELSELLHQKYATILRDPVISIELKDFERPYFVAAGAVERPGKYELRGDTTLTQALAVAGGFKADGKRTNVVVFHRGEDPTADARARVINVKKLLEGRALGGDVQLEPGDLVFVSRSRTPSLTTVANIMASLGWLTVLLR